MTQMIPESSSQSWLPTRQSLLSRLRDVQDQTGWREFFDSYWRLIYGVAVKSGLGDAEAQDVVQETFIYLSRKMPNFRYDPARGSFKSWLRVVTRSRIAVHRRSRQRKQPFTHEPLPGADDLAAWEAIPDPAADALDTEWQREWEEHLLKTALERVRPRVSSQQLLIFRLAAIENLGLNHVAKTLGVSLPQVYLARHRVGRLFKSEVQKLRQETE